jgi:hypothetical protein
VPVLAELVDAVVGVDTHRDTHQVEIAHPTGTPIATCTISNDSTGYGELLAWIRLTAGQHHQPHKRAHRGRIGRPSLSTPSTSTPPSATASAPLPSSNTPRDGYTSPESPPTPPGAGRRSRRGT